MPKTRKDRYLILLVVIILSSCTTTTKNELMYNECLNSEEVYKAYCKNCIGQCRDGSPDYMKKEECVGIYSFCSNYLK